MIVPIFGKSYIIPNSNAIVEELFLPSFLNRICWEEILLDKAIRKSQTSFCKRLKEISHICAYIYDVIKTARYNFCMFCTEHYSESFIVDGEDSDWLRTQYLVNSLMWYNLSFDQVLQIVYLYYGLFKYDHKLLNKEFETENIDNILERCRWGVLENNKNKIDSELYKVILDLKSKREKINDWTVKFKHRGNLLKSNDEEDFFLKVKSNRDIDKTGRGDIIYDSSRTQSSIPITDIIESLKDYHKVLIETLNFMCKAFNLIKDS